MKLHEYLKDNGLSYAEFGAEIGRSSSAICRWIKGSRAPSIETAARIHKVTGGAVKACDFVQDTMP